MNKLNPGAFEFVPGQVYGTRISNTETQKPVQRPEQLEAPLPPPTISLSIGAPKPTTLPPPSSSAGTAPAVRQQQVASKSVQKSTIPAQKPDSTSKIYSSEKAKTDAADVALEVEAVADQALLVDLFGNVKEHLNIVFVGHVDAGKSTFGGNILFITGMVDKRTMEKYEREAKEAGRDSWYLSWALDSTPQERTKGKTVEVGRAYFETPARRYTILDAPGHKTFVPSMISGAAQADVAILVISARKGEFETGFERGGQTREHIMLVKTAGVSKIVVAINKMDESTVDWKKQRYDEIKDKLTPFIRSAGFNPKTDVQFIPVSAFTGLNIQDRVSKSVCPWWDGPSFLELIDNLPMVDRKVNAPLMMPISEKYRDMGTVVVGKIESGLLRKGDLLALYPNKDQIEVVAIFNEMEEEIQSALCGDNVRIRVRGVEDEDVTPGFVLTNPRKPIHTVRRFEAQLAILEHKNIICAGYSAVMHIHTLAEEITLVALLHYFDKATGRKSKKPPQFARKGQKIVALIETTALVCVERFSDYPQLGRFTLRDEGKTIAIGKITKLVEHSIEEVAEGVSGLMI